MRTDLSGLCGPFNSSNFANWLGAIGTLIAALIAVSVYIANSIDKRKSQARLVSCSLKVPVLQREPGYPWERSGDIIIVKEDGTEYSPSKSESDDLGHVVLTESVMHLEVRFANHSDEEISRVRADLLNPDGSTRFEHVMAKGVCPPRYTETERYFLPDHLDMDRTESKVRLYFTDASGQAWTRESGSSLKKVNKYAFIVTSPRSAKAKIVPQMF